MDITNTKCDRSVDPDMVPRVSQAWVCQWYQEAAQTPGISLTFVDIRSYAQQLKTLAAVGPQIQTRLLAAVLDHTMALGGCTGHSNRLGSVGGMALGC